MSNRYGLTLLALTLLLPVEAAAQRTPSRTAECQPGARARPTGTTAAPAPPARLQAYDVVVDVPELCVERLRLKVENLDAHLSLDARVANLVRVNAGADVFIGTVDLGISGVRAEALLLVDLDNLVQIVDEVLTFIDQNPQVVSQLVGTVQHTVRTVGGVAGTALQPGGVVDQTVNVAGRTLENLSAPGGVLSQTVNTLGQTLQRTLDASGNIVERTLDTTGNVVNQRTVGRALDLPLLEELTNNTGQTLRRVQDTSGAIIELTLDSAGRLVSSRVVTPATGAPRR